MDQVTLLKAALDASAIWFGMFVTVGVSLIIVLLFIHQALCDIRVALYKRSSHDSD